MKEIKGDLITLAKSGEFDVIGHGCNCFCKMGAGIAPQIKKAFNDAWVADQLTRTGDKEKLGTYTSASVMLDHLDDLKILTIVNIYSQFSYDARTKPIDYDALEKALIKVNSEFKGKSIGLPLIGAGLAGGDWGRIVVIIERALVDMDVTIVHYNG